MNIRAYIPTLGLLCAIYILHVLGIEGWYSWYWYDIMMHFLGGAWVGCSACWLYYQSGVVGAPRPTVRGIVAVTLSAALLVGIGWEIFEYMAHLTEVHPLESWKSDITKDIIMDMLGAATSAACWIIIKRKELAQNFTRN